MAPSSRHSQNVGQIIEYIPGMWLSLLTASVWPLTRRRRRPDRLYLASYVRPPTAETLFPGAESSPRKRSSRAPAAASLPSSRGPPCYFTVDDSLLYNAFHHDFGPLHIGHLYRFAIRFHDILGAKENKDRPVVFWSAADPRSECPSPRVPRDDSGSVG